VGAPHVACGARTTPYGVRYVLRYGARLAGCATYGVTYGLGVFAYKYRHRNSFSGDNTGGHYDTGPIP
jgi:hypothetical protein